MKVLFFHVLAFFIFIPSVALANIEITEIMYDQEGIDTDYEWVEIYNTGSNTDISQWHFYENDVHHGLFPDGFTELESGERALIVQNIEIMRSELGNTVNLIKSSFLLHNTGEELAMSDADKLIHSSAVYSSDDGASGNGHSLQKTGNNWIQATPTPGLINATSGSNNSSDTSISSGSSTTKKETITSIEKKDFYTGFIKVSDQTMARSTVDIQAHVIHTKDTKTIKKIKGGTYFINFGDGSYIESDERIDIEHIYEYPGIYEIVFEFYSSRLAKDNDKDPKVITRKKIEVTEPSVEIVDIDVRGTVILHNTSDIDIDLGEWGMYNSTTTQQYVFPKYSIIQAGEKLYLPQKIHNLKYINSDEWIVLRNENTISISSYTENTYKLNRAKSYIQPIKKENKESSVDIANDNNNLVIDREMTPLELFLEQHPNKELVDFGPEEYRKDTSLETGSDIPTIATVAAGIGSVFLVGMRLLYKKKSDTTTEIDNVIGEIELVE